MKRAGLWKEGGKKPHSQNVFGVGTIALTHCGSAIAQKHRGTKILLHRYNHGPMGPSEKPTDFEGGKELAAVRFYHRHVIGLRAAFVLVENVLAPAELPGFFQKTYAKHVQAQG